MFQCEGKNKITQIRKTGDWRHTLILYLSVNCTEKDVVIGVKQNMCCTFVLFIGQVDLFFIWYSIICVALLYCSLVKWTCFSFGLKYKGRELKPGRRNRHCCILVLNFRIRAKVKHRLEWFDFVLLCCCLSILKISYLDLVNWISLKKRNGWWGGGAYLSLTCHCISLNSCCMNDVVNYDFFSHFC